jgi:lipopolysaccharide/colanic/teichoic acid biosynthesis glycosyltransferase
MMLASSAVTKRMMDIIIAATVLVLLWPLLALIALAIYLYDFHYPFYIAPRVGLGGKVFQMVKFRSMTVNADRTGVTSTSVDDDRITPIGRYIRAFKLDELVQFWNVLWGDMSLVGPRPNVPSGVAVYTLEEQRLLTVRPGITDFASIVFADEGNILGGRPDPTPRMIN